MKQILLAGLLLLTAAGCSTTPGCPGAPAGTAPLRILFIGNSYTFTNDLPAMLAQLACSGGRRVETATVAPGGWTLAKHAASAVTLDRLKQKWDVVVLQEQSEIPAAPTSRTASMYPAVHLLVGNIRAGGAQPVLFMTWGHRTGSPRTGSTTYAEMQAQIRAGYLEIARELGVTVAPVGYAWLQARLRPNPLDLWQADGSHPNPTGTYLAACVFYATLFRQSPQGLSYVAGLPQPTAQALQLLAAGAVADEGGWRP